MRSLLHTHGAWLLALAAFLLYIPSVTYDYAYDDKLVILKNSFIKQGVSGIPDLWTHTYTYGANGFNDGLYRPVSTTAFAIQQSIAPDQPWLSHATNAVLYAMIAWLLFHVLMALQTGRWAALFGTALFVVHPLHTEAVANIKSADELFALLFALGAILWVLQRSSKAVVDYGLAGILFLLAVLSKESAVAYAVLLPLVEGFRFGWKRKEVGGLALVTAVVGAGWYWWHDSVVHDMANPVDSGLFTALNNVVLEADSFGDAKATGVWITFRYFLKMLWPWPMINDYSPNALPVVSLVSGRFLLASAVLTATLVWAFKYIGRNNLLALGVLFFFVLIAPVSNVFLPIGTSFGERLAFGPSLAVAFGAAWVWPYLKQQWMQYGAIGILGLATVLTLVRSHDWRSNFTLFAADVVHQPDSFRTHYNYATELGEQTNEPGVSERQKQIWLNDAVEHLKRSLEIRPEYPDAINNLASMYQRQGKLEEALQTYRYAVQVSPNYSLAFFNAGMVLKQMERYEEAHNMFQQYLTMGSTEQVKAWYWSGVCSGFTGQFDRAATEIQRSLALNPQQWEAWNFLGMAYGNLNRWGEARQAFERGLQYAPNQPQLLKNLELAVQSQSSAATQPQ